MTTLPAGLSMVLLLVIALILGVPPVRRQVVTRWLMRPLRVRLPRMGDTERIALEAGTVWWDGDLFSGAPDWRKLLDFEVRPMSDRERAFLDGPVEELCAMLDEWTIAQAGDLPPQVWDCLKRHRFLGMIIPEEYGGLGFSAIAHSAVVTKLASRSVTAAVTVMVPNSLGPAELLLRYGTEAQKRDYLPRLAAGQEIPCFALTGPEAGSDAAATQSLGVVCRGTYEGREVLGLRLTWRKRYITLGSQVARSLLEDRDERLRLTRDIYVPPPDEPGLGRLEAALDKVVEALAGEATIRTVVRAARIDRTPGDSRVELALEAGVITEHDRRRVRAAAEARDTVIQVDAFDPDEYRALPR